MKKILIAGFLVAAMGILSVGFLLIGFNLNTVLHSSSDETSSNQDPDFLEGLTPEERIEFENDDYLKEAMRQQAEGPDGDETAELDEEDSDVHASARTVDKPESNGATPYPYNPSIFKPEYRYTPPPLPASVMQIRRHWDRPGLKY